MIVGVDEAGRGPLAGVVVGCALHLKRRPPFVPRDSKKLSEHEREAMFVWLRHHSVFALGIATPQEIDEYNILEATFLSFTRAITQLLKKAPALKKASFIIDGNLFRSPLPITYRCLKGADRTVPEVSCASIMAKVMRDHLMKVADCAYPQWKFSQHKGYPTKEHYSLLEEFRLSPIHRRSFAPCREVLDDAVGGEV